MTGLIPFDIQTISGDIRTVKADIIALKYANGFHGADSVVAKTLGIRDTLFLKRGEYKILQAPQGQIAAPEVFFLGVGDLAGFRYEQIRKFSYDVLLIISRERPNVRSIAMTIHGVHYGLDVREAVFSICAGCIDAASEEFPGTLRSVYSAETNERMRLRIADWILSFREAAQPLEVSLPGDQTTPPPRRLPGRPPSRPGRPPRPPLDPLPSRKYKDELPQASEHLRLEQGVLNANDILKVGVESENKPHIFVAMPFSDDYLDEWEIGVFESANAAGFLCERMDVEVFVGDVLAQIKDRIDSCSLLIAILTGENPNVYLEIGYAWGGKNQQF